MTPNPYKAQAEQIFEEWRNRLGILNLNWEVLPPEIYKSSIGYLANILSTTAEAARQEEQKLLKENLAYIPADIVSYLRQMYPDNMKQRGFVQSLRVELGNKIAAAIRQELPIPNARQHDPQCCYCPNPVSRCTCGSRATEGIRQEPPHA